MHAVKSNEEMASDFITVTCQLLSKSLSPLCDHMHDLVTSQDPLPGQYAIVCGSKAEFYIRPLNTCISDIDVLLCATDELVFSDNFPVLPSDIISGLADRIRCYGIVSNNEFPGFVRLRILGEMEYNWKLKEYKCNRFISPCVYVRRDINEMIKPYSDETFQRTHSGPAMKSRSVSNHKSDFVLSIFCPQWPTDAQTWPLRPRNNGWPTGDTISEVVRNGCHVVYVQHRACRNDINQWRLSFSVAEVILLHSWTKTQQIVYHLLRFFAKRELIKKDCSKEDEVLCTYHLKTLMLWTCEEMPSKWWDSSPVIALCCELLSVLSDWLKRRHCPNYFIPEANLFHQPSTSALLHQTESRINYFRNYGILSRWFVENYILPITLTKFQFLNTRKVVPNFMDYILPLIEYRKAAMSLSVEDVIAQKFGGSRTECRRLLNGKAPSPSSIRFSLKCKQTEAISDFRNKEITCLPTTEGVLCFKYYDFLLYSLHFAHGLSNGEISWDCSLLAEFVNAILLQPKMIRSQFHNFPKTYRTQSNRYQSMRALGLMKNLTGLNSRSEFQLLYLLSKEFLRRTLEIDDYESNGVTTAALAYLAALHFASSEYQETFRLCLAVLSNQTPKEEKETLNAACLLFIDGVARMVGLCVLHKKITDINLHCIDRRLYLDLRLSPKVFALYMIVLYPERRSTHLEFGLDLPDLSFPMDYYMKVLIKPTFINKMKSGTQRIDVRQVVYCRIVSLTETEVVAMHTSIANDTVIDLLMEIALENMISFYSVILKDFGMQCNIVDCYRALYFYKRLIYDEVLQLCERILNETDLQSNLKERSFANVLVIPPLVAFFDGNVQSLLGFHTLFYYLSPLNDDLHDINLNDYSPFERWFAKEVSFARLGLSVYPSRNFPIICHYFLGRHFLARYLKVRCCIDCNLPYKEAMTEFAAEKVMFPFELIIRRFLLRRHRIIK